MLEKSPENKVAYGICPTGLRIKSNDAINNAFYGHGFCLRLTLSCFEHMCCHGIAQYSFFILLSPARSLTLTLVLSFPFFLFLSLSQSLPAPSLLRSLYRACDPSLHSWALSFFSLSVSLSIFRPFFSFSLTLFPLPHPLAHPMAKIRTSARVQSWWKRFHKYWFYLTRVTFKWLSLTSFSSQNYRTLIKFHFRSLSK